MGQMASMFNERQQGNFPSTLEVNPKRDGKEHCKTIKLRNGKNVERSSHINAENDEDIAKNEEGNAGNSENSDEVVEKSVGSIGKIEELLKNSASKEQRKTELKAPSREDSLIVPYPQRLKRNK